MSAPLGGAAAERAERASLGRAAARFLREKACFCTLQTVILVLCAQAALRYASGAGSVGVVGGAAGGGPGFFARTPL